MQPDAVQKYCGLMAEIKKRTAVIDAFTDGIVHAVYKATTTATLTRTRARGKAQYVVAESHLQLLNPSALTPGFRHLRRPGIRRAARDTEILRLFRYSNPPFLCQQSR
jgi:hypothetical protein